MVIVENMDVAWGVSVILRGAVETLHTTSLLETGFGGNVINTFFKIYHIFL